MKQKLSVAGQPEISVAVGAMCSMFLLPVGMHLYAPNAVRDAMCAQFVGLRYQVMEVDSAFACIINASRLV